MLADRVEEAGSPVLMRLGLVPFWANGEPPKSSTIDARIETLESAHLEDR
jgi:putative SOS response-associated peptidase YedK